MLKSKLLMASLVVGLAACNSVETGQPAPVKVEAARPVEVEVESMAAKPAAAAGVTEEAMTQTEEPAAEPMTETEQAAAAVATEEAMAKTEAATSDEGMVEADMVEAEEPVGEGSMAEESMAQAEAPAAEVMAEAEETSGEMVETAPAQEAMMAQEAMAEAGPTEAQVQLLAGLDKQGMPPELFNQVWLNSDPLKLADLHGKVVIVEFWTFGCYNCKNVVPSLRAWHHSYSDQGLVIIGVHTPEFGYEGELENVKQALIDQDIPYAVAIDNDWQTWRAYNNRYWPAKYFIDKAGNLRHVAIGEGRYEEQEEIIEALLAEKV